MKWRFQVHTYMRQRAQSNQLVSRNGQAMYIRAESVESPMGDVWVTWAAGI
jgi:hypothetical protein